MTEEAARVGFDWDDREGVFLKIKEEMAELKEALASQDRARIEDEMGDILLSFVNLSRFAGISAEEALEAVEKKLGAIALKIRYHEARTEDAGISGP